LERSANAERAEESLKKEFKAETSRLEAELLSLSRKLERAQNEQEKAEASLRAEIAASDASRVRAEEALAKAKRITADLEAEREMETAETRKKLLAAKIDGENAVAALEDKLAESETGRIKAQAEVLKLNAALEDARSSSEKLVAELHRKLESHNEESAKLSAAVQDAQSALASKGKETEEVVQRLKGENNDLRGQLEGLKQLSEGMNAETGRLNTQLAESALRHQSELALLQETVKEQKDHVEKLQETLQKQKDLDEKKLEESLQKQKDHDEKLESEKAVFQLHVDNLTKEMAELRDKAHEAEHRSVGLEKELTIIKEEKQLLDLQFQEAAKLSAALQESVAAKLLEAENQKSKMEELLSKQVEEGSSEAVSLKRQVEVLKQQVDEGALEVSSLKDQLKDLTRQNETAFLEAESLKEELTKEKDDSNARIEALKSQGFAEVRAVKEQFDAVVQENEGLKQKVSAMSQQVENSSGESGKLLSENSTLRRDLESCLDRLNAVSTSQAVLLKEAAVLRESAHEAEHEVEDLEKELQLLKGVFEDEKQSLSEKAARLEILLQKASQDRENKLKQEEGLVEAYKKLEQSSRETELQFEQRLASATRELDAAHDRLLKVETSRQVLVEEAKALREMAHDAEQDLEHSEAELVKLKEELALAKVKSDAELLTKNSDECAELRQQIVTLQLSEQSLKAELSKAAENLLGFEALKAESERLLAVERAKATETEGILKQKALDLSESLCQANARIDELVLTIRAKEHDDSQKGASGDAEMTKV
jgi:chromosome segregation ATPase